MVLTMYNQLNFVSKKAKLKSIIKPEYTEKWGWEGVNGIFTHPHHLEFTTLPSLTTSTLKKEKTFVQK